MLVFDLTEESKVEGPSLWLKDNALAHRGDGSSSGTAVIGSTFCGRRASADSARGGRESLVGEGVEAALDGSGRDPTGRAGRLFRRLER